MVTTETGKRCCLTCRFYDRLINREGLCRRYAPRPQLRTDFNGEDVLWPRVWDGMWCGEHQKS